MGKVIDITDLLKEKHALSEVICVKCGNRWLAVRPAGVWLKSLECKNCGPGFVVETGQNLEPFERE